jgi:hypothetical protein
MRMFFGHKENLFGPAGLYRPIAARKIRGRAGIAGVGGAGARVEEAELDGNVGGRHHEKKK